MISGLQRTAAQTISIKIIVMRATQTLAEQANLTNRHSHTEKAAPNKWI